MKADIAYILINFQLKHIHLLIEKTKQKMPHKRKGTKGTKGIEGRKAIYGITDMKLVKTNISQLKVAFMPFMEMLIDRLIVRILEQE